MKRKCRPKVRETIYEGNEGAFQKNLAYHNKHINQVIKYRRAS